MTALSRWIGLGLATAVAAVAFDRLGLPSASLFAALLVGVAAAVLPVTRPKVARASSASRRRSPA